MKTTQLNSQNLTRGGALLAALVLCAGLAACDKKPPAEPTAGQKVDAAIAKTEAAADEAKAKMESAAKEASQAAQAAASNAAVVLDDAALTTKVKAAYAADPNLSALLISVDTKDGVVTISGPVKTAADKEHAARLAQAIEGVKSVVNQLNPTAG